MKVVLRKALLALIVAVASIEGVQKAQAQPVPIRLDNTLWVGQEDLPGYGDLTFRFHANGQAAMSDKDGTDVGTYRVEGVRVTLYFHNGSVVYNGVIDGRRMSGRARSGQSEWNFSVEIGPDSPPRPRFVPQTNPHRPYINPHNPLPYELQPQPPSQGPRMPSAYPLPTHRPIYLMPQPSIQPLPSGSPFGIDGPPSPPTPSINRFPYGR